MAFTFLWSYYVTYYNRHMYYGSHSYQGGHLDEINVAASHEPWVHHAGREESFPIGRRPRLLTCNTLSWEPERETGKAVRHVGHWHVGHPWKPSQKSPGKAGETVGNIPIVSLQSEARVSGSCSVCWISTKIMSIAWNCWARWKWLVIALQHQLSSG